MSLLNTAAGISSNSNSDTTEAENIYAANAALAKPKKVSSRPVEPVPGTGRVSNDALVSTQLDRVLATDGPLLKRARTDGFASAAERGLNNSSIGVQAGEEAVIRQALPIAQQDAQSIFTADENSLGRDHQTNLQRENNQFQAGENAANRSHQSGMQANEFTFNARQNELTRSQQLAVMDKEQKFSATENQLTRDQRLSEMEKEQGFQAAQQDKQNSFSSTEQDKMNAFNVKRDAISQGYNLESIRAQTSGQIEVAASQLDERTKGAYLDAASNLQRSYIDQQTAILNNPALKKDVQVTNALNVAKQNFESSVSYLQGLYAQGGVRVDASAFPSVGPVQSTQPPSAAVMPAVQAQLNPRQTVMAGRT